MRWTSIPQIPIVVSTAVNTRSPANAKGCSESVMDRYSLYTEDASDLIIRENMFPE